MLLFLFAFTWCTIYVIVNQNTSESPNPPAISASFLHSRHISLTLPNLPADKKTMILTLAAATLITAATVNPFNDMTQPAVDSNIAYFEGANLTYVFRAPDGFRLDLEQAAIDGLSLAFIPEAEPYNKANILIGATIFSFSNNSTVDFAAIVEQDTIGLREHYDGSVDIRPIDPIPAGSNHLLPTVYLDHDHSFVPTVMVAYFDGATEVIIFELVISDRQPRFKAEPVFDEAIRLFKALKKGTPNDIELGSAESGN